MRIFISHASQDAEHARKLAESLRKRNVEALFSESDQPAEVALDEAASRADAFVFLIGREAGTERRQELEWRSAVRSQWDPKPMVPVQVDAAALPPFLRHRTDVRLRPGSVDYDRIASRVLYLIEHPDKAIKKGALERAQAEQRNRFEVIEQYAIALQEAAAKERIL